MLNRMVPMSLLLASFSLIVPSTRIMAAKRSFDITGNGRTHSSYIAELAENCLADHDEAIVVLQRDLTSLEQCLLNSKLFAEVKVSQQDAMLSIRVVERWTLIPAPFYSKSGKTTRGGLVVFDTNLLGQGLTLGLGASVSNRGNSFFGFFVDPSILASRFFTLIMARQESSSYELKEHNRISQGFLEKSIAASFSVGYHFSWVSVSGQLARMDRSYRNHEDYSIPMDYKSYLAGINLEYDKRDYKLYFSEGTFFRTRYLKNFGPNDGQKLPKTSSYLLSWQHQAFADHAVLVQTNGLKVEGGRVTDAERVGSAKGFRGIESRSAWAESYQTETLEYQVPLKRLDKGTLTTALFADWGHLQNRGGLNSVVDYSAAGAGIYFYLRQLAFPGIGIETGTNQSFQGGFVNVSVGLAL